jgi:hypothetical protein
VTGRGQDVDWEAAYRVLEQQLEAMVLQVARGYERLEALVADATVPSIRHVRLVALPDGRLRCTVVADGADLRYAFRVLRDDVQVREEVPGEPNTLVWEPARSGRYRVEATVRRGADAATAVTRSSASLAVTVASGSRGAAR